MDVLSPARAPSGLYMLCVGWRWFHNGANSLAYKVGGGASHPLMLTTLWFGIAALTILAVAVWRWRRRPASIRELAGAALLGVVILIGSQTIAVAGTHLLPAGVASIFGWAAAVFLALFIKAFLRESPGRRQSAGIVLGLVGLGAIACLSWNGTEFWPTGAVMTLATSATWAAGSLVAARLRIPDDSVVSLAAQLAPAAITLSMTAWLADLTASFDPGSISTPGWEALGFPIFGSTLVGYAVFPEFNRHALPRHVAGATSVVHAAATEEGRKLAFWIAAADTLFCLLAALTCHRQTSITGL